MNKTRKLFFYVLFDILSAIVTWFIFFIYRKYNVDHSISEHFITSVFHDSKLYIGMLALPAYWCFLHTFIGAYTNPFRKSRLRELEITILTTFFGTLIFFFAFILDDMVTRPFDYVKYFVILLFLQFLFTYVPRVLMTTFTINRINSGKIGFKTLIIGSDVVALNIYQNIIKQTPYVEKYFLGYIQVPEEHDESIAAKLPCLGTLSDLASIVKEYQIKELVIAIQNGKRKLLETIITSIGDNRDLMLKIIPQSQDFLIGNVKISAILQEPLISISTSDLPVWQHFIKRFMDVTFSMFAMLVLLPLYLFCIIGIKLTSKGPIFYLQERIGLNGKPFQIIKFRSMITNAETGTPLLSTKDDPRITKFGHFMRKTRMDEIPQFANVLLGDMSLVGPRPERQYYIDQLVKVAPHYKLLLKVKPGMTSWGQVKFGYAENIDEMVERLKWDILYLDNMSLQTDIKILIYTALIVLKGKGK
ncbi:MAG: sugar transferase [Bacteroidetes bacterium]|nr:sugar transferase [Bacteroidota bacterium]MCL1968176.1 sugar transferase [Bacteroidota bacterium]MCL1968543.1 sugar transferase [Bacteroidota bacterium]